MPITEYKETQRTLVTDLTVSSVTAKTRGSLCRQTAANLISKNDPITDIDVSVNEDEHFEVPVPIKHLFVLTVPNPVRLTITHENGTQMVFEVKDFFLFNGKLEGTIAISGYDENYARCDLIYA